MRFLKIYLQILGIIAGIILIAGIGLFLGNISDVWAIIYLVLVWAAILAYAIYKMEEKKEDKTND